MAIEAMYKQTATTQREGFVSGSTVKRTYAANLASFACCLQPLSAEAGQIIPGGFGKTWLMFCAVLDIKEGDKVTIDSKEYRASGVETYNYGINDHMEVILTAFRE